MVVIVFSVIWEVSIMQFISNAFYITMKAHYASSTNAFQMDGLQWFRDCTKRLSKWLTIYLQNRQ